jgi:hypothetical protein
MGEESVMGRAVATALFLAGCSGAQVPSIFRDPTGPVVAPVGTADESNFENQRPMLRYTGDAGKDGAS